jgi:hypothetical protein
MMLFSGIAFAPSINVVQAALGRVILKRSPADALLRQDYRLLKRSEADRSPTGPFGPKVHIRAERRI